MIGKWLGKHELALQEAMSILPSARVCQRFRARYYRRVLKACGSNLDVSQNVLLKFPGRISVGDNVFINRGAFLSARSAITIGDNTLIGPYVIINTGDHRYGDGTTPIRRQGHDLRPVVIQSDVWIGAHAVVLKGTMLGQGCVVAAGAVVTADVAPYTVVAGVPARPLRVRELPTADEHRQPSTDS